MIRKELCKIIHQTEIAKTIFELTVKGEFVNEIKAPDSLCIFKVCNSRDPLLRRPIQYFIH